MFLRLVLDNSLFSPREIHTTLRLLPSRRHVVWRDSVGVQSSESGLKMRLRGYFSSEFSLAVAPYWRAPKRAKQLSIATIPLCFEVFRCRVDVLQSYVSRSTISIAVFCLQNLIFLRLQVKLDPVWYSSIQPRPQGPLVFQYVAARWEQEDPVDEVALQSILSVGTDREHLPWHFSWFLRCAFNWYLYDMIVYLCFYAKRWS